MENFLLRLRYYLEIISVPIFAFLVIHLSGHATLLLFEHEHAHETETAHQMDLLSAAKSGFDWHGLVSIESFIGFLLLLVFVWLWHRPWLKNLVPCSHSHCHHVHYAGHLAATGAFVFHFFAESGIRYQLLQNFSLQSLLDVVAMVGFVSHFLVDIIIMVLLSLFWKQVWQRWVSGLGMLFVWGLSFVLGTNGGLDIHGVAEPLLFLFSAFLLAMFVHAPHRPVVCGRC